MCPVLDRLIRMLFVPLSNHVRDVRDVGTEDERQTGGLDGLLVARGHHPGIGDHGDLGQVVGGLERADDRQHRGGLGLVALERVEHQREPGPVGEQPDRDLRLPPR